MKFHSLILIGAALAAAVSCGKDVVVENETDMPVDFSSYQSRSTTKADAGGFADASFLPDGSSFGVFAFFHAGTTSTPGSWNTGGQQNHPNFMLNQKVDVTKDASDNYTYNYSPDKYWPSAGNRISFYAYYPHVEGGYYMAQGVSDGSSAPYQLDTYMDKTTDGQGSFGFDVAFEAKDQVDFMISDLCADQNKKESILTSNAGGAAVSGTVYFKFHHVLSQVRIGTLNVDKNNDDVTITPTAIRFSGIAVHGECSVAEDWSTKDANGLVQNTFTWSNQIGERVGNEIKGVHVDYTGAQRDGESDEEYALRKKQNYLLMIPQTFDDDATITIIYDVERKENAAGEQYKYKDNEVSAKLNAAKVGGVALTAWEPNKIYNYTATVTLEGIELSATSADWTEGSEDLDLE